MAGCGGRGARYLQHARADVCWSNDGSPGNRASLVFNTAGALRQLDGEHQAPSGSAADVARAAAEWEAAADVVRPEGGLRSDVLQWPPGAAGDGWTARVSQIDAPHLLASRFLAEDFFDLIDIDSFGADLPLVASALGALAFGGLLYITSTDGFTAGGRRPERALAAFGAYARPTPCANEQGLRLLIGAAVQDAAARGIVLTPLFSLFSYHGPVFRVMLRATRGQGWAGSERYGFVGHCNVHHRTRAVRWDDLGNAHCRCDCGSAAAAAEGRRHPLTISGPMWTGPLHDAAAIDAMAAEAAALGWTGRGAGAGGAELRRTKKNGQLPLETLLQARARGMGAIRVRSSWGSWVRSCRCPRLLPLRFLTVWARAEPLPISWLKLLPLRPSPRRCCATSRTPACRPASSCWTSSSPRSAWRPRRRATRSSPRCAPPASRPPAALLIHEPSRRARRRARRPMWPSRPSG